MDVQPQRRFVLAGAGCAAATLGVLFNSGLIQLRLTAFAPAAESAQFQRLQGYTTAAAVIVALLVPRLLARTGWAWLLLAGSVLALPLPLSVMEPRMFDVVPRDLVAVAVIAATTLTLFGVLGAASWVRALGAEGSGGALAGAAVVAPGLGVLVVLTAWFERPGTDIRWLLVGFGWLAVLGAGGAVVAARWAAVPLSRPDPRLLVCGTLAALAVLVPLWISPADVARLLGEDVIPLDGVATGSGKYFLVVGLTMAGLGLVLAFLAGRRILFGALVAGLAGLTLGWSGVIVVAALPGHPVVVVVALLGGLAVGWLAGRHRWRTWFAVAGLGSCGIAALMSGDITTRQPAVFGTELADAPGVNVFGVAVVVVGVAAIVAAVAAVTPVLTDESWLPATFGAFAAAVQTGGGYLVSQLVTGDSPRATAEAGVSGAGVLLLLSAMAVAAGVFWPRPAEPVEEDDDPTVELEREAVWFRLPDDA